MVQRMFWGLDHIKSLIGIKEPDFMIGLSNLSWHLDNKRRAVGGSDFWVSTSRFGRYINGSHPWAKGGRKNAAGILRVQ